MTQEEVIEGNKLIAEFLGWETEFNVLKQPIIFVSKEHRELVKNLFPCTMDGRYYITDATKMLFNILWDWLMLAIVRIRDVHKLGSLQNTLNYLQSRMRKALDKIEDYWFAVVECIKYLNKNKQ